MITRFDLMVMMLDATVEAKKLTEDFIRSFDEIGDEDEILEMTDEAEVSNGAG